MENPRLRRGCFGFNRGDVVDYLAALNEAREQELKSLRERLAETELKLAQKQAELSALYAQEKEAEAEKPENADRNTRTIFEFVRKR